MHVFMDADAIFNLYSNPSDLNYLNTINDLIKNQRFTLHITDNILKEFFYKRRRLFSGVVNTKIAHKKFTTISRFIAQKNVKKQLFITDKMDRVLINILRVSKVYKASKLNILNALSKRKDNHIDRKEIVTWEILLQHLECDLHLISGQKSYFYKNTNTAKENLQGQWERNVFNPFKIFGYRSLSSFLMRHFPTEMADKNTGEMHIEFLLKELPQCKSFSKVYTIINSLEQFSFNPEQAEVLADNLINNHMIRLIIADHDMISFTQRFVENYELTLDSAKMASLKKILLKYASVPMNRLKV